MADHAHAQQGQLSGIENQQRYREYMVDREVAAHEDAHSGPLGQTSMRAIQSNRNCASWFSPRFFAHLEVAISGAVASLLASGLHLVRFTGLTVLTVAVAVLCSSRTLGASLRLSVHTFLAAVLGALLSLLIFCVSALAPLGIRPWVTVGSFAVVSLGFGLLHLSAVARKIGLGVLIIAVVPHVKQPELLISIDVLLELVETVLIGNACALVATLAPWPRSAATQAYQALRASAAGVVLLFDSEISRLISISATAESAEAWRSHHKRVLEAAQAQLHALPSIVAVAAWQPQWAHRRALVWRKGQQEALFELWRTRAMVSETLAALAARELTMASASHGMRILQRLQPELARLADCARNFAAQVSGDPEHASTALSFACQTALDRFDEAFRRARLHLVYGGKAASKSARIDAAALAVDVPSSCRNTNGGNSRNSFEMSDETYSEIGGDSSAVSSVRAVPSATSAREVQGVPAATEANADEAAIAYARPASNAHSNAHGNAHSNASTSAPAVSSCATPAHAHDVHADFSWAEMTVQEREDMLLAYSLLFWISQFVRVLARAAERKPFSRRTLLQRFSSAMRRICAVVADCVRSLFADCARVDRLKDATRLAVALSIALLLAKDMGLGFWAPVTAAFVWEPGLGASLRNSGLRLQGSVLGVFFGYACFAFGDSVGDAVSRDALLLLLFGLWSGVCCFVRAASKRHGYAGFVASFTAIITLVAPDCGGLGARDSCEVDEKALGVSKVVLMRIQMTLIGIMSVLLTSVLIFPVSTPTLVYGRLAEGLLKTRRLFAETHEACLLCAAAAAAAGGSAAVSTCTSFKRSHSFNAALSHAAFAKSCSDAPDPTQSRDGSTSLNEGSVLTATRTSSLENGEPQRRSGMWLAQETGMQQAPPVAMSRFPCADIQVEMSAGVQPARQARPIPLSLSLDSMGCAHNERNGGGIPHVNSATSVSSVTFPSVFSPAQERGKDRLLTRRTRVDVSPFETTQQRASDAEAHDPFSEHILELRSDLEASLRELALTVDEAADQPECCNPFPAEGVRAILKCLGDMLHALSAMHTAMRSLEPGHASMVLIKPLMKPLNRLELQIAEGLLRLLQKLRCGDGTWLEWIGSTNGGGEPLARIPDAQRLFDRCYHSVLHSIVSADQASVAAIVRRGGGPTLSNADVLAFNALVYSIRAFVAQMETMDRLIEDVLVSRQPLDLYTVNYV